jgi:RNA polymerase sigma factor (sigma-70 family)
VEDPGVHVDEERQLSQLWDAVDGLSPRQRAVVLLQCREGLATKEIAEVLDMSEATVRVHLHRAFATLRRRVGGKG